MRHGRNRDSQLAEYSRSQKERRYLAGIPRRVQDAGAACTARADPLPEYCQIRRRVGHGDEFCPEICANRPRVNLADAAGPEQAEANCHVNLIAASARAQSRCAVLE